MDSTLIMGFARELPVAPTNNETEWGSGRSIGTFLKQENYSNPTGVLCPLHDLDGCGFGEHPKTDVA